MFLVVAHWRRGGWHRHEYWHHRYHEYWHHRYHDYWHHRHHKYWRRGRW